MISEPIVTFWLNNPFSTIESAITIGALTPGANKGGYSEHKIINKTNALWEINMKALYVNGALVTTSAFNAIVDPAS